MISATTTVNLTHLLQDLRDGDLITWGILGAVIFFTGLQAYQKLRESTAGESA